MVSDSKLCGVAVTYHPQPNVVANLRAMVAECGRVIVVDNGSDTAARARLAAIPGVELIALERNVGIATALNLGAERARETGHGWIVTFDQDSRPLPGMVNALRATAHRHPRAAVIAPRILEDTVGGMGYRWVMRHPRTRWLFRRSPCAEVDLPSVTMAITSGSLLELATWERLGRFEDALFIDYVDIDYCLKVVRAGRTIAVSAGAKLEHKLGARQSGVLLGHEFRPTHHLAFRHYYMARNRIRVWRQHARSVPHWALFDLSFAFYNAVRVAAFEPGKALKLKAMFLGAFDGLRSRSGPIAEARWTALSPMSARVRPRSLSG